MSAKTISLQRRCDLDWLRVLAILAVFVFHSGRFFDQMGWHVKSTTVYAPVQAWILFLSGWLMPLVIVISGASLFYAVGKGSFVGFIRDKVLRLLVPLIIGVFTHVSLGVYLERTTNGRFLGSFFEFYPHYFDGWYGFGGNFAWMGLHLWYLLVLFVFSLAFLPLFSLLKGPARNLLNKLGNALAVPGIILVLIVPIVWLSAILDPRTGLGQRNFGGWPLPIYICFLFYGFIIFSNVRLQARIQQMRWFYLTAAITTAALLLFQFGYAFPRSGTKSQHFFGLFFIISSWCWILAFIGFTCKYMINNTRVLKYANEAVLPFYIMHQTVLLVIGYFVLRWPIPDPVKWLVIALSSFGLVMGIYEFLVRRFNATRFLFGMKPMTKQPDVPVPEPVPA